MPGGPLAGKVAVVTGASRGIGQAIALELAQLGAKVVVTARTVAPRDDIGGTIGETMQRIESAGGTAVAVAADLAIPGDIDRLVEETLRFFGRVDILVNNAAAYDAFSSFWDMSIDGWRNMFELNVHVPWMLSKTFGSSMRAQGSGLIVNVTSRVAQLSDGGLMPLPGAGGVSAGYSSSKAALSQFSAYVGNELRAVGVTMVGIDPGFARSEHALAEARLIGADLSLAQPVEVAAKAIGFIAASPDVSVWAAKVVVARELVDEHQLLGLEPGQGSATWIP
jgi:NAD(P)-dependent dehydrogenase (short-subunit alcohol dehydrogenase family)